MMYDSIEVSKQNVVLTGSPAKIVKEVYFCWLEFNKISI